jgi:hypothetical protein
MTTPTATTVSIEGMSPETFDKVFKAHSTALLKSLRGDAADNKIDAVAYYAASAKQYRVAYEVLMAEGFTERAQPFKEQMFGVMFMVAATVDNLSMDQL